MPPVTGPTASLVVSTPVTSQGWRPISVTYQPARVATQPEKAMPTKAYIHGRGSPSIPRPRRISQTDDQDSASIAKPRPTITRKA